MTCGVIPIVTCLIEATRYAVVNATTFDNVDRSQLVEVATDYDQFAQAIRQKLIREIYPPLSEHRQEGRRMAMTKRRYWLAKAP